MVATAQGPSQRSTQGVAAVDRWHPRVGAARALAVAWYAGHLAVAVAVTHVVARALGRPDGTGAALVFFVGLALLAAATTQVTQRLARPLLSLRALLALNLAFPGAAPSRLRIAFRAGGARDLADGATDGTAPTLGQGPVEATTALLGLVGALARHDRVTAGHSERVRAYAELIGEQLGLDEPARDGLRWGALVHDVGKLRVPAAVLNKPTALTPHEWALIRRHPEDGAALAAPLRPWLGDWTAAVLDHHERWDGDGYPRRLAATDISLAGRVVAVADAYDVMTSARSYQRPRPAADARAELARCAGSQFDAHVVRAFLAVSVRRLGAIAGPLSLVPGLPTLRWGMRAVTSWVAPAIVATAVAGGVWVALPDASLGRGERPAGAGTASRAAGGGASVADGAGRVRELDTGPAARPGADVGSRSGSQAAASRRGTAVLGSSEERSGGRGDEEPTGGGASGGGRSGGSGGPDDPPAALVVDPEAGSVSVEGLGPPGATEVPIVQSDAAGAVSCDVGQVCSPVVVPLPVP